MLTEIRSGEYIGPSGTTVAEWLDKWLATYCNHISPYTKASYVTMVAQVKAEIGDVALQKLSAIRLQEMVARWESIGAINPDGIGKPLAARTIRKSMACLSAALNRAVKLDLLRKNPMTAVVAPRVVSAEVQVVDVTDSQRLLSDARDSPVFMPVLLALTTGMRRGEICGLRWQDVDYERSTLYIKQAAIEVKGAVSFKEPKTGKARAVTVPPFVLDELRSHKKRQAEQRLLAGSRWQESGLVNVRPDGSPISPSWLSGTFGYFAKTHGYAVTFHGLRHSHASILLESGVDMKVTQERLGHSTLAMTADRYSHISESMQRGAAERLEVLNG
jgi:integrase